MLKHYILPDGTLDSQRIWKSEILYTGMNGRHVERFYVSPAESYIFKPLTNDGQKGKERWVYEHLLPSFPPIYPKLLDKSDSDAPDTSWMIFEDLGILHHVYDEELALKVIPHIVWWHGQPTEALQQVPLKGPKPPIGDITADVAAKQTEVETALLSVGVPELTVRSLFELLERQPFTEATVLCHGDLHLGNYTRTKERLVVLDWEHVHLNSRLWDLYHLIDMSHPLFPKRMTPSSRNRLLDAYIGQALQTGTVLHPYDFKQEYYLFAAVFSIWMLLLIRSDLERGEGVWPQEALAAQLRETLDSLTQCAEELFYNNESKVVQ
ncbi:phosphotransferase [Paenibacillus sp. P96]|uniref:Phosphotransferase n=1 Tax=Paenibacillus zeirhizosphaerae TaxID=2987519 RepID=A0ABT9FKS5_9BACL|nr:phosphotransferase [Paenibacillus sp. P96]MDP4095328.1 phosphotransferase [Paenibacillus sp. P96]